MTKKTSRSIEVLAYGNRWKGVTPGTALDLHAIEAGLQRPLPVELAKLAATAGGGEPTKSFFESKTNDIEVTIGYVLPLKSHGHTLSILDEVRREWSPPLPANLIPFAVDNGHSGLLCVRVPEEDVVYWIKDDSDPIRNVTSSLGEFLSQLKEDPY